MKITHVPSHEGYPEEEWLVMLSPGDGFMGSDNKDHFAGRKDKRPLQE